MCIRDRSYSQRFAAPINDFCREFLNPYVNLHRPCLFAKEVVDAKGKIRKTYPQALIQTPLDRLASLHDAANFLRTEITIEQLQSKAKTQTDLEVAKALNVARLKLFDLFNRQSKSAA